MASSSSTTLSPPPHSLPLAVSTAASTRSRSRSRPGSSPERTPTSYRQRGLPFFHNPHSDDTHDDHDDHHNASDIDHDDNLAVAGSWWGDRSKATRPWHNPPKRRKTIPPDQTIAYERTKLAVTKAASSVLGNLADVGHEALAVAADVLHYTPIMGLGEAARLLLVIWDSVEAVQTNRMSCLRLTERCATILYSIRAEVDVAGPDVAETLREPLYKLTESFQRVQHFIQKQVSRPFLKRYLKRDEDARKIWACDASLTDSVGLFSVAIQIRMLKEVQGAHALHVEEVSSIPANPKPHDVLAAIATLRAAQAAHDSALDTADLYAAMRAALRMNSDIAMLDVLQIERGEMLEALKTLQRALEDPQLAVGRSPQPRPIGALGLITAPADDHFTPIAAIATTATDAADHTIVRSWRGPSSPLPSSPSSPLAPTWDAEQDAAFHREFLESGIDALRRISGAGVESLPPWTITRWEVDREERIGVGFFSDVFRGGWRGRQVAIKILAPTAPREVFRHEAAIWASLKHPHVLELLGASSAAGDPPWFFVSPYMRNGTLVAFLKSGPRGGGGGRAVGRAGRVCPSPLQMMYEVAVGMAYLHRKEVWHGDLKANNVLIDDDLHCVISDFGQSKLKSEVLRLSNKPQPHGTLRWQAPEILAGEDELTPAADVYAFAIVCVEILTRGDVPWAQLDDAAVSRLVLQENKRPKIPLRPETSLALLTLIEACWAREPRARPGFVEVARGLAQLEGGLGSLRGVRAGSSPRGRGSRSPGKRGSPGKGGAGSGSGSGSGSPRGKVGASPELGPVDVPVFDGVAVGSPLLSGTLVEPGTIPLQRVVTPSAMAHQDGAARPASPVPSEVFTSTPEDDSSEFDLVDVDEYADGGWDGYESPPPRDERVAARRNERRYRLLLQHDFNPSLNLPLWDPSPVRLGAVGFLSKPSGSFVTLFNAYDSNDTLPSIHGYGAVKDAVVHQDRRNLAQKGMDIIQGLLTFRRSNSGGGNSGSGSGGGTDGSGSGSGTFARRVSRRHSFPLRAGHKHAYLYTENTTYRYMVNMDAAKAWFRACVGEIVRVYGGRYNIQREDVFLVIGTLEARDWGLFVSHEHPDGQVHFNVYSERREGQEWGSFSTDTALAPSVVGPVFAGPDGEGGEAPASVHASRISPVRDGGAGVGIGAGAGDAVLLARLRFKPDADEPTRL